ncbi:hypothetical protein FORC22_4796 (plasmid) [Vibrio parahaemolyticus]|nr:hypothetical protein FORC22_4796 [Vibrio parahaemolyticus]
MLEKKNWKQAEPLTYTKQYKGLTGNDPYQCVLCGKRENGIYWFYHRSPK